MKYCFGWSDIGSPNKPRPLFCHTEQKIVKKDWIKNITLSDAKKLTKWWNSHTIHKYYYEKYNINGRFKVIQEKKIYY